MTKYSVESSKLVGFAAEKSEPGKTVKIITKCNLATSDEPVFHIWMRHISGLFFQNSPVPIQSIHKFLILLHEDDIADVYINDFQETSQVRVTKDIKAGDKVYVSDISDISDIKFPEIEIKPTDSILYGIRIDWRFSLYFDFGRNIDIESLSKELGELRKEGTFYSLLKSTNAQISRLDPRKVKAIVLTEGKSDWKHLLAAMDNLKIDTNIAFVEDEEERGADDLYKMCEHYAELPQPIPMIFIFDRDKQDILRKLRAKDKAGVNHQEWGNNVYSLYLPIPNGRTDETHAISIEFFYTDNEITRTNSENRRLFLSNEFNKKTGNHTSESLHCTTLNKISSDKIGIIDSGVFDGTDRSWALSKDAFAESIRNKEKNFDDFNFTEFKPIYNTINEIIDSRISH